MVGYETNHSDEIQQIMVAPETIIQCIIVEACSYDNNNLTFNKTKKQLQQTKQT